MLTVNDVYHLIDRLAPFDTQEDFDNSGLIVGSPEQQVHGILVVLDVTWNAVQEAKQKGADLIVSHHPLLFHARKRLVESRTDPEARILCELVRSRISVISAHTNLDLSNLSGSACIARGLELQNVRTSGFLFIGQLPEASTAEQLNRSLSALLHVASRLYGAPDKCIKTVAVCGGAYDIGYTQAISEGCDALITGETRHHNCLAAAMQDFVIFDATHYGTENILVPALTKALQNDEDILQYKIHVFSSEVALFG